MQDYKTFMINDRKSRIEKNNEKIEQLKIEMYNITKKNDDSNQKIEFLTSKEEDFKRHIEYIDNKYKTYTDEDFLFNKLEHVQYLNDLLEKNYCQLQFINCFNFKTKKKLKTSKFLTSFKNYYKYKKTVELEENGTRIGILRGLFSYTKQYIIFKNSKLSILKSDDDYSRVILNFETKINDILSEIDALNIELEERKNFLKHYSSSKSELVKYLDEIYENKKDLFELINSDEYGLLNKECIKLENENNIYEAQINNILEIDKLQKLKK